MKKNPNTMLASFVVGPGRVVTERTSRPGPGDGLLLKTLYCGVCGSDRRQLASADAGQRKIIGHEIIGEAVDASGQFTEWVGRRVGIAPRLGCGTCGPCRRGQPNICDKLRVFGYQLPGGFAQFVAVPGEAVLKGNVIELPRELDAKVAALAEPLSCVLNGLGLSHVEPGRSVLVMGAGPMGQMFVIMTQAMGCRVTVLEPDATRREFALAHGAAEAHDPASGDAPAADLIIVACSNPDAYQLAFRIAPAGATINLFGGLEQGVMIDSNQIHYRQLTLHGTSGSTPGHYADALKALVERPRMGDIVTDVVPLDGLLPVLLAGSAPGRLALKTLVNPWMV
jgi:L-iditol 2-dehydrogenase